MRLYALVQAGDPEAIDVYLAEEDAQRPGRPARGRSVPFIETPEQPLRLYARSAVRRSR